MILYFKRKTTGYFWEVIRTETLASAPCSFGSSEVFASDHWPGMPWLMSGLKAPLSQLPAEPGILEALVSLLAGRKLQSSKLCITWQHF